MSTRRTDFLWMLAMAGTVVCLVAAAILAPAALLVLPAGAMVYALTKPWARLLFFVVGAFFVFQSGDGISVTKLAYLGAVVFAAACSIYNLGRADRAYLARVRPALIGAGLLAVWILGPVLVQGLLPGNVPPAMWARDALTYLLVSAGVFIGLDAATSVSLKWARLMTVGVGLLAAYGFATEWIGRRGLTEAAAGTDASWKEGGLLGSMAALTLPLALCLVLGLAQRRISMLWLLLAPVFLLAVLVTGTRTGVVLAVALIGVIGASMKKRVPPGRAVLGGALGVGALSVALPIAGAAFSSEYFVQQRMDQIVRTVEEGFGSDASGLIRQRATNYCLDIFKEHPLMGQGLGIYFPNPNPGGFASNFSIDSWAVLPAKFGLIGTAVVVTAIIMIFHGLIRKGEGEWLYENAAVRAAFLTLIALVPFGTSPEDKGFSVTVALAAALVGAAASRPSLVHAGDGVSVSGDGDLVVGANPRVRQADDRGELSGRYGRTLNVTRQ
ncbi:O-antigen ligase family protein [Pseudarthrobacter oxydans]|uniref:O-antigen ligase family protein n=1 Tax=Pseudarthrobacter oxydans TaxID=1671 RepID=UPI0037F15198